jgi:hypothetical protein
MKKLILLSIICLLFVSCFKTPLREVTPNGVAVVLCEGNVTRDVPIIYTSRNSRGATGVYAVLEEVKIVVDGKEEIYYKPYAKIK